jgi:hypothetical protein
MCEDDESIDDNPELWWACQAIILDAPPGCLCHTLT